MPRLFGFQLQLSRDPGPITVEDYRRLARRRVPDMVWAYVDYGAEDLVTLEANRSAFARYAFRRHVFTGSQPSDISRVVGGQQISMPVLFAPTGGTGLSHWMGERGAAQAAERAGTLSIASTAGSYSYEEVAEGTERDHFFQLYPHRDTTGGDRLDLTRSLMKRAEAAGYAGMFVTADVAVSGNRESERRRGMGRPPILTPGRVLDAARKPRWWWAFLRYRRISLGNFVESPSIRSAMQSVDTHYQMIRAELTWDDFAWMRENWKGPLYLKGIVDPDDAEHAVDLGADGVVVSNHGGRQLDGDVATLDALPAIVDRVGDRAEVLLDGGVRRGSDVVKALCLGAHAVCVGRPFVYGMGAAGPAGARRVAEIFREEIIRVMTLLGVSRLDQLNRSMLIPAGTPVPSKGEVLL